MNPANAGVNSLAGFADAQAENLNVEMDYPFLEKLAQPCRLKSRRVAGIRLDNDRIIRLLEALMHSSSELNGINAALSELSNSLENLPAESRPRPPRLSESDGGLIILPLLNTEPLNTEHSKCLLIEIPN